MSDELDKELKSKGITIHKGGKNYIVVEITDQQLRESIYGHAPLSIDPNQVSRYLNPKQLVDLGMWDEATHLVEQVKARQSNDPG